MRRGLLLGDGTGRSRVDSVDAGRSEPKDLSLRPQRHCRTHGGCGGIHSPPGDRQPCHRARPQQRRRPDTDANCKRRTAPNPSSQSLASLSVAGGAWGAALCGGSRSSRAGRTRRLGTVCRQPQAQAQPAGRGRAPRWRRRPRRRSVAPCADLLLLLLCELMGSWRSGGRD